MADNLYEVVFRGRVLKGHDVAVVKQNLARLFKIDESTAEKLFSGQRVSVKKGLDEPTAKKYRDILRKAGANVNIVTVAGALQQPDSARHDGVDPSEPVDSAPDAASANDDQEPDAPETVGADGGDNQWVLDPLGTLLAEEAEQPEPEIDTSDLSVAEVGVVFDAPVAHEAPSFDFSELTVDDLDETIVSPVVVEPITLDLSQYSAAEPGEVLPQPDPVETPEFDLSGMNIAEAGVQLVVPPAVPPAQIATDHLGLEPEEEPAADEGNPFLQDD